MARSNSLKTMHTVQAKAREQLDALHPDVVDCLFSWSGPDLTLDVNLGEGDWRRYAYIPDDDLEVAGVRELA